MATDTFALTWNIGKQGRGDKKHLERERRFEMQSNITYHSKYGPFAQFNSIRTSRHLDGHTNTETSFYYLHGQTRETDWRPTSGHLPHYYVFTGRSHIPSVLSPHNLGASFWEYISKCSGSEVSMSDGYLFLLELRKSIIYFGGSIIQDNGQNVVMEHLLLLARI